MKKKITAVLVAAGLTAVLVAGCGSSNATPEKTTEAAAGDKVITVGATPTPHAEILNEVVDDMAEMGYELNVVVYNDYVQPNVALDAGDLDANYFQHKPYLDNYNKENGTNLVSAFPVHYEPMRIYAGKTASLDELKEGATVAVPNDATNEARALLLLEQEGIIKLNADAGVDATILDIAENPLNLQFIELEAAQAAKSSQDVDIIVVNSNYALEEGIMDKALAMEAEDSLAAETYSNDVVVRAGEEDSEKIQALKKALLTEEVKEFINTSYEGVVLPVF